jgi:hypothetical protein
MPRKTADERHLIEPDATTEMMDVLVAPPPQAAASAGVHRAGARPGP